MNESSYKILKIASKKLQDLIKEMEYNQSLDRVYEYNELFEKATKLKGQACFDVCQKAFVILNKHSADTTLEKMALLRSLRLEVMKIGGDISTYEHVRAVKNGFRKALIVLLIFTIF